MSQGRTLIKPATTQTFLLSATHIHPSEEEEEDEVSPPTVGRSVGRPFSSLPAAHLPAGRTHVVQMMVVPTTIYSIYDISKRK